MKERNDWKIDFNLSLSRVSVSFWNLLVLLPLLLCRPSLASTRLCSQREAPPQRRNKKRSNAQP